MGLPTLRPHQRALLATFPALALFVAVPLSFELGTSVPVSFMLFFAAIVLAGAIGGHPAGLIAGTLCAAAALYLHLRGIGPKPLIGTRVSTAVGMTVFVLTGLFLGILRFQRDRNAAEVLAAQADLKRRLAEQSAEHEASLKDLTLSEARLEQAARVARLGYFIFNIDTETAELCSDRHAEIFGFTAQEFISRVTSLKGELAMIHPDDRDGVREAYDRLSAGQDIEMDYRFYRDDGTIGFIREYVTPETGPDGHIFRGIGSSIDLTTEKQTEERLRQSQKLNAIGQLTAGVAHDFNNLLTVILGNAELLEALDPTPEQKRGIEQVVRAAERGGSLTRSLLSFAQKAQMSPEPVDPNSVLADSARMFRRTLFESIELKTDLTPDIGLIELDRNLLDTAILNLVINARDAIYDGGAITIETAAAELSRNGSIAPQLGLAPGRYVRISVIDTGDGIASDLMHRVTEPFFTTKNRAVGSGLGLSMVQGFVAQSKGGMQIVSAPLDGTTVHLYFPVIDGPSPSAPTSQPVAAGAPPRRRALLVEDDAAVRQVLDTQLSQLNVEVTSASDGDAALRLLTAPGQYDVAVIDNIMPGSLSGLDVAKAIRRIDPGVGIILQSGDTSALIDMDDGPVDVWLRKPVKMAALAEALGKAHDAAYVEAAE